MKGKTINYINAARMYIDVEKVPSQWADECINWLKTIKDRYLPQTKYEWSQEDKKRINHIIQFLEDKDRWKDTERAFPIEEDVRWLKSLRPQNKWKPSDEQMKALWKVYKGGEEQAALASLYSDLKKLKRE